MQLGARVEAASPSADQLDQLFEVYRGLVPIFEEGGRSIEQREAIDRMLRLSAKLSSLRQAQALDDLARYFDENGSIQAALESFEQSLAILRTLPLNQSKPGEIGSQITSTLVNLGRAQALTGNFSGAVSSLQEAIRRSESSTAAGPHIAKNARALYWSHIALGDVFGSPARFNLGRPNDAVEHYEKARAIADKLVDADPENEVAKLDLTRALLREGMTLAASQPGRALALLESAYAVATQTSSRNHSGLESRFDYLICSVVPLVRLGYAERARMQISEARGLLKELKRAGVNVNERLLFAAEAIRLYAAGQPREALAETWKQLALIPEKANAALAENFETIDALERVRMYAAGVDAEACGAATEKLARIWQDLRVRYPHSAFVQTQFERVQTLKAKGCVADHSL